MFNIFNPDVIVHVLGFDVYKDESASLNVMLVTTGFLWNLAKKMKATK